MDFSTMSLDGAHLLSQGSRARKGLSAKKMHQQLHWQDSVRGQRSSGVLHKAPRRLRHEVAKPTRTRTWGGLSK